MSLDQLASSPGYRNSQPPPVPLDSKTPTTIAFPSPVLETPKQPSGCWTPRFADEYSVFSATPGNFTGSFSHGGSGLAFGDFGSPYTPYQPPAGGSRATNKRPFSPEGLAEDSTAHAACPSPNPNPSFSPINTSRILSSTQPREPPIKRPRLKTAAGQEDVPPGQTITPPPSIHKGGARRLARKVRSDAANMQNDHGFLDFYGSGDGQIHNDMAASFVTSPGAVFGFPLSAPASASLFTDAGAFWDTSAAGLSMDIDFSTAAVAADMFQPPPSSSHASHRPSSSLDWGRANQMFQETGMLPHQQMLEQQHMGQPSQPQDQQHTQQQQQQQQQQQNQAPQQQQQQQRKQPQARKKQPPPKRERPLAPKAAVPNPSKSAVIEQPRLDLDTSMYQISMEDSFTPVHTGAGVDPGLLFSRPPSANLDAVFNSIPQPQQQPTQQRQQQPSTQYQLHPVPSRSQNGITGLGISKAPLRPDLQRSMSVKEPASATGRASPIKTSDGRPGLTRSFSENRGKRSVGWSAGASASQKLPLLAPALKPAGQPQTLQPFRPQQVMPSQSLSRPSSHGSIRSSGRSSPLKAHHPHRLSSLSSIPETSPAWNRTSVRFTIDANGRASVETVAAGEDEVDFVPSGLVRSRSNPRPGTRDGRWYLTDEDYDDDDGSSSDDELIIIPSRPTSFALPDPLKVSGSRPKYLNRSGSGGGPHSNGGSQRERKLLPGEVPSSSSALLKALNEPESEAETVVNDTAGAGDALSELERLRKTRMMSRGGAGGSLKMLKAPVSVGRSVSFHQLSQHSVASSPATTIAEGSLGADAGGGVRCVCANSPGAGDLRDGFMVQCESCEMWLHGRCININKRSQMPSVYICAYCAQTTPGTVGRGGRMVALSPLAHKSFPKFR